MEDDLYFCYFASLRISGDIKSIEEITDIVGVQPTHTHRKGEKRSNLAKPNKHDMWCFEPHIDENEKLTKHLCALWAAIGQNAHRIKKLKDKYNVDIFCGYRSNCDHAGFELTPQSLTIFQELEIPFNVSVIVISSE